MRRVRVERHTCRLAPRHRPCPLEVYPGIYYMFFTQNLHTYYHTKVSGRDLCVDIFVIRFCEEKCLFSNEVAGLPRIFLHSRGGCKRTKQEWPFPCSFPHGGVRPFHQMSTCLYTINFRASCGLNFVTPPPKFGGPETPVLHRLAAHFRCSDSKLFRFKRARASHMTLVGPFQCLSMF